MKIITPRETITIKELEEMSQRMFEDLVKAVVDVKQEIMVVDAELHSDQEAKLLDMGSDQGDLWGINLYPQLKDSDDFVEFDSMINLRPSWGNTSRGVDDEEVQQKIVDIVDKLVR